MKISILFFLFFSFTHNSKLYGVFEQLHTKQLLYYERSASYGSKHALQSLSLCYFVCTYIHNSKTTGHYKDILHIERQLYYQRCLFSWLDLYARYNRQVMAPKMHHSLLPIHHLCVLLRITIYTLYFFAMNSSFLKGKERI